MNREDEAENEERIIKVSSCQRKKQQENPYQTLVQMFLFPETRTQDPVSLFQADRICQTQSSARVHENEIIRGSDARNSGTRHFCSERSSRRSRSLHVHVFRVQSIDGLMRSGI